MAKTGCFDPDYAARVLADATIYENDAKVAKKHKCSVRTIERYRVRMRSDPALAESVRERVEEAEKGWHRVRNRGLTVLVERMIELSQTKDDLDAVTRAVKALGELDIAKAVLGNDGAGDHQSGSSSAEDAGGVEGPAGGDEPTEG